MFLVGKLMLPNIETRAPSRVINVSVCPHHANHQGGLLRVPCWPSRHHKHGNGQSARPGSFACFGALYCSGVGGSGATHWVKLTRLPPWEPPLSPET